MASALCPNCRNPLSENARFCMECGSRIDFGMTRKELGEDSTEEGGGLRVNRNETASSPFYGKYSSLRDKIINPKLAPLPEKKSFSFKSWDEIKNSVENTEEQTFERESEAETIDTSKTDNEVLPKLTEEPEMVEKDSVEETEGSAEATDFDALKELFIDIEEVNLEEEQEEEPVFEEPIEEDVAEAITELTEEPESVETENVWGPEEPAEGTVELQEEATDFEALKELFIDTEEVNLKEEQEEEPVSEEPIEEDVAEVITELTEEPETVETEKPEEPEELAEGAVELQEEATDFEALKELFTDTEEVDIEEEPEEVPVSEEPIEEVVTEDVPELTEGQETVETEKAAEAEEAVEVAVELQEEATDFEALKELFTDTEEVDIEEEPEEAPVSEELIEEVVTEDEPELTEDSETIETEKPEETEELAEAAVELQEEATDFEALKELFTDTEEVNLEEEPEEAPVSEEPIEEAVAEAITELTENPETVEVEKPEETEESTEETVELQEEATDFESLKELFTDAEETIREERQKEASVSEESREKVVASDLQELREVLVEETTVFPEETSSITDFLSNDFSEKICDQIDTNIDSPAMPSKKTENRIITSTVGGGFRRRESQAEEVREITSLFGRKKKR